jgi:hypothetical protein
MWMMLLRMPKLPATGWTVLDLVKEVVVVVVDVDVDVVVVVVVDVDVDVVVVVVVVDVDVDVVVVAVVVVWHPLDFGLRVGFVVFFASYIEMEHRQHLRTRAKIDRDRHTEMRMYQY